MHMFEASEKFSDESEREKRSSAPISVKTNLSNDVQEPNKKDEKKLFLDSIFKQKDPNSKAKEEDARGENLKKVSMEAKKRVNVFLCESATKEGKLGCEPCRRTADPTDTSLPCCFQKSTAGIENTQVGFLVRYAVLSCVRATEPEVREAAITNFRRLSGMDDSEAVSDIKKMVEMPISEWQSLLKAMYKLDLESYAELETLTRLLFCAVQCVLKTSTGCTEDIWQETIDYYRVTGLRDTDIDLYHCSMIGNTGVFGYLAWFTKFVMYSIGADAKTRKLITLAEMWKFNTNVCPALVVIYKHGSGRFPWMEALVQNFTNVFGHLWTKSDMTREAERKRLEDWETPTISHGCLAVRRSVVPRLDREAKCYQCDKRLPKTAKKIYPVCFQSVHREEAFPREVATLERYSAVRGRDVMGEDLVTFARTVRLACSTNCLLRLMALVNPAIMEILEMDPGPGREPGEEDTWPDIIDGIKYFALRHLMEQHFYSKEFAARRRKEQTRLILENCRNPSPPTRLLPETRGPEEGPPKEMQQYHHNLLLHDAELKCSHERMWAGVAKFHPTKDLDLYNLEKNPDGTSKKIIEFDIEVETCDRLDIHLQTAEQRQELASKLEELKTGTLHLFHSSLSAIPVDFLRASCHKLVTTGLNSGCLRKVFSHLLDKDAQCLLGIWTVDMDARKVEGLIVCKNPKTCYAFKPQDPKLFWKILTEGTHKKDVYRYTSIILNGLTGFKSTENGALPDQMLRSEHLTLAVASLKAFSIIRMDTLRLRLVSRLSEAQGKCRFVVAQSGAHNWSEEPNVLLDGSNGSSRFTSKHLVGCPHSLKWQGTVMLEKYTLDGTMNDEWSSTGWALECRENNSPEQLGRPGSQVPLKFWGMLPSQLFILTMSNTLIESFESEEVGAILNTDRLRGRFPKFILELGSVPANCLEDMKNRNVITLSFVSENQVPRYIVLYELVDGKIHSSVEDVQKHVDAFYLAIKRHCYSIGLVDGLSRLFGEVATREGNGEVTFKPDSEPTLHIAHNQCQGCPDKSLGNVLWTGELELCFLHLCDTLEQPHKVAGMTRHKDLYDRLQHSIIEVQGSVGSEGDLGSVRNCAFVSPTNHHTFSTYASVVSDHTLPQGNKELMELFSNKSRMDNSSLVAFNVERKIVENVIGTFKKCFFFYLHVQDSFYIHKEMEDLKATMVAFFLKPQEMMSDLVQLPAAVLGPRLLLLRYDHRMGVLVAYVPKERGKGQQLWQKLAQDRDNLVRDHERLWRKISRPEPEMSAKDSEPSKRMLEKGWTSDVASDLRKKIELVGGRISQKETEALFESFEALVEPKKVVKNSELTRAELKLREQELKRQIAEKKRQMKEPTNPGTVEVDVQKMFKMNAQERFDLAISVNSKVLTSTSNLSNGARPKDVQVTDPRKCKPTVEHKDEKIRENKKAKTPDDIEVVEGAESLTVPAELLAALAGPGGDKDKIINSMKSMGINLGSGSSMSTTMTMTASISASGLSSVTGLASMDAAASTATGSEKASVRRLLESMEETDEDLSEPKKTKKKQKKVKKKRGSVDKSPKENGSKESIQEDLAAVNSDPEKICWACRKPDTTTKLSKCRGCRKARYCSPECQQTDWKRHGEYCRGVAARNKERTDRKAGGDIVTID